MKHVMQRLKEDTSFSSGFLSENENAVALAKHHECNKNPWKLLLSTVLYKFNLMLHIIFERCLCVCVCCACVVVCVKSRPTSNHEPQSCQKNPREHYKRHNQIGPPRPPRARAPPSAPPPSSTASAPERLFEGDRKSSDP